ncbi:hypothetical protein DAETH_22400 [Deinococcus aetherius]|uniref:Uncharacterized protein n=1 Tax=Deinococcus aetherius TaxID=200252 RepID=A0ABM8AEV1_9DEIO|nr:hypothetical protein DAETH_22400 [Deinococcus aetherius]
MAVVMKNSRSGCLVMCHFSPPDHRFLMREGVRQPFQDTQNSSAYLKRAAPGGKGRGGMLAFAPRPSPCLYNTARQERGGIRMGMVCSRVTVMEAV